MKKLVNYLSVIISIVILSSCTDVVQVKLSQGSKLYVIDAFVNDLRSAQTIRVITNDSYFSDREAPPVPNAIVVLKDLTANHQYNFNYTGDGNYVFNPVNTDTLARVGHQYELDVTIDGQLYTALTTQKRTAKIDSISEKYHEAGTRLGKAYDAYFTCTLWAIDKVDNNADYYWVKTFRNDTLFSAGSDINVCIDGTGGAITTNEADSLNFTPPATFLGFKDYPAGSTCKVEIHSLSYETYNFLLQAAAQINNGGLFATTPENVKTNIVTPAGAKIRSVGFFNMATVATKQRLLP